MSTPGSTSQRLIHLPTATAAAQGEILAVLHKGANWLFTIAGLSVVNTTVWQVALSGHSHGSGDWGTSCSHLSYARERARS